MFRNSKDPLETLDFDERVCEQSEFAAEHRFCRAIPAPESLPRATPLKSFFIFLSIALSEMTAMTRFNGRDHGAFLRKCSEG